MPSASEVAYWTLAAVLFWLGLRWFERVQLYIPSRELWAHPGSMGLEFEEVRFHAADGVPLHGWWIPSSRREGVVLLLHGNGGNISNRVEKAKLLHGLGLSVLLFDYRGYGQSGGRPTEAGLYRDAEAAYRHLVEALGVEPGELVVYGESLGCGVAVELARRREARALVLESPFTSVVEMGKRVFPWLPVSWMVRDRFDNLTKIPAVRSPLLVLHSPEDEIVPFAMGRRLFEAAAGPKEFARLRGDHNAGFLLSGPAYVETLGSFLRTGAGARRKVGA